MKMTFYIKEPYTAIFTGSTGCGKRHVVSDLIEKKYNKHYDYIIIICPTLPWNKTYHTKGRIKHDDKVWLIEPKDQLKVLISKNLDILVITETKLDSTFPVTQFLIEGYKSYILDRNRHGGGILVYVREDIPGKELTKHTQPSDIEGIFLEINLRKTRWLLFACYHPPSQSDDYFFKNVGNSLDLNFQDYSKFLLVGDFNAVETEPCLSRFLNQYDSRSFGKASTCFKNPQNPSYIDLIITNSPKSFENTESIPTGLSDFHNMVVSVLKSEVPKGKPKEIFYRNYKNFDNSHLKAELRSEIELNQISDYNNFENVFL